jgi:hypothetical protein
VELESPDSSDEQRFFPFWAEEWVDIRGVYRFSSLVKQNKKAKNCAVFCFAGKRFLFLYL